MRRRPRIAVGGFLHETNTFATSRATYASFEEGGGWPGLLLGDAVVSGTHGVNISIAGLLASRQAQDWDLLPTLWCAASPSGPVTEEAFERIAGELLARLRSLLPLDAVYLDLHGAMVTETIGDGEGELLGRVRSVVGPGVPVVASLDLHANMTPAMVAQADLLVGFRTYPHVDMAETGQRTAAGLARLLAGERLVPSLRRLPFLIPIIAQCTDIEPSRGIYAALRAIEAETDALPSWFPGFPAADFPHCRPAVVCYADSPQESERIADEIAGLVIANEPDFDQPVFTPDAAIERARSTSSGPVVIADVEDNPGAGGSSDTTGILRALVAAGVENAAIGLIVDPAAAQVAFRAGVGHIICIGLGGHSGISSDEPLEAEFRVEALSDGHVQTSGPYYGRSPMNLGPSACLRIGGVRIVVASNKAQMADLEMFRFVGIEPGLQRLLVVKSSVHFRAAFAPIAHDIVLCSSPGAMPADPADLPWTSLAPDVRTRPLGKSFVPGRMVEPR